MAKALTKVVEVEWKDANGVMGWNSREEYLQHDVAQCRTVGYLLKQTKDTVIIALTQGGIEWEGANGAIAIPISWVTKMKVLRK